MRWRFAIRRGRRLFLASWAARSLRIRARGRCSAACSWLAAVLTCRLTAKPLTAAQRAHSAPQRQAQPDFAAAFSEAVRRAGMSAIHVCMFVTVFSVLSGYLRLAAGAHLPADAAPLALGALELSAGCAALRACTLAPVWKLCIASFLLSFGGLSILAQSRAAAADAGLEGRQAAGLQDAAGGHRRRADAAARAAGTGRAVVRAYSGSQHYDGDGGAGHAAALVGAAAVFSQKVP